MGHSAGDELICTAAECILSVFESLGHCYRMGGDEFLVLLQNITESQVNRAMSELELCISCRNLTRPFPLSLVVGHAMGQDSAPHRFRFPAERSKAHPLSPVSF